MKRWRIKKNSVLADIRFEWYMDVMSWLEIYKKYRLSQELLLWQREFGTTRGFFI